MGDIGGLGSSSVGRERHDFFFLFLLSRVLAFCFALAETGEKDDEGGTLHGKKMCRLPLQVTIKVFCS